MSSCYNIIYEYQWILYPTHTYYNLIHDFMALGKCTRQIHVQWVRGTQHNMIAFSIFKAVLNWFSLPTKTSSFIDSPLCWLTEDFHTDLQLWHLSERYSILVCYTVTHKTLFLHHDYRKCHISLKTCSCCLFRLYDHRGFGNDLGKDKANP